MALGTERERKFLVVDTTILDGVSGSRIHQTYLVISPAVELRVRKQNATFSLTAKVGGSYLSRGEEEFFLESEDIGTALLGHGPHRVEKDRYGIIVDEGSFWDVDVFLGANKGLVLAEIELDPGTKPVSIPSWCGREVTGDPLFYNANLATNSVASWTDDTRRYYGL